MHDALSPLAGWENFYVIVGSSAGALTGLQFVVMALIAESRAPGSMLEVRAFGSPTLAHFCAALVISAIASAPWHSAAQMGIAFAVCGAVAGAYALSAIRHARRQTGYAPDAEDWFWYFGFPFAAYVVLLVAGALLAQNAEASLFAVAAVALVLLLAGIRNAWDTVTYIAVERRARPKTQANAPEGADRQSGETSPEWR